MAETRVLVTAELSPEVLSTLVHDDRVSVERRPDLDRASLLEALPVYDGWIVPTSQDVDADLLEAATSLRVLCVLGADTSRVDVLSASRRGVVVMHAPSDSALATAEHSLALLLAAARGVGTSSTPRGGARELTGATLGLVGLGHVGRLLADRARGLHLQVIAADPKLDEQEAMELGVERASLEELLERSDFVCVQVPANEATRHLIDAEALGRMKDDAILVSTALGDVVDLQALAARLEAGGLGAAAIDTDAPADSLPASGLVTPRIAGDTREARTRIGRRALGQLLAYLEEGTVEGAVNVPNVPVGGAEALAPYLELASRLGRLLAQLADEPLREVRVTCSGEAGHLGVTPVANAALSGLFSHLLGEQIHSVRAPHEAEQRGIEVVEVREMSTRYAATVRVSLTAADGVHTATGALGAHGEPRLIGLEGYDIDATMEGSALLMKNEDRPGVIGAVGTMLGERGINVARMQVGLDDASGRALALWMIGGRVPDETLDALRALSHVEFVCPLSL